MGLLRRCPTFARSSPQLRSTLRPFNCPPMVFTTFKLNRETKDPFLIRYHQRYRLVLSSFGTSLYPSRCMDVAPSYKVIQRIVPVCSNVLDLLPLMQFRSAHTCSRRLQRNTLAIAMYLLLLHDGRLLTVFGYLGESSGARTLISGVKLLHITCCFHFHPSDHDFKQDGQLDIMRARTGW